MTLGELDVDALRRTTLGATHRIHFNNAGASLPPDCVHDAVVGHLDAERRIGGYEAKAAAEDDLEGFYASAARLLNARADEIAFIENATRAFDMAFYAIPFRAGDRILTAEAEYTSNVLAYLQVARRSGVTVEAVPSDAAGGLDIDALEAMIDGRVKLISITHVPTYSGLVNPAAAVGAVARRHGILYLLDACQSAGQLPLDVDAIGCDMLSATGRKYLRGPRGTGFLYVRRERLEGLEPPFIDLHAARWVSADRYSLRPDARRFENWECYFAGKLGLKAAIDYALELGVDAIGRRVSTLGARLREALAEVPGVRVWDRGPELCGIVTFTKDDETPPAMMARLRGLGINVSVSDGPAHLDPLFSSHGAVVRASVHAFNTEDEISHMVAAVAGDSEPVRRINS